jgi:hypothetical protein
LYFTSSAPTDPYNQQIHLALADNDLTFAGTGTSGSYLWGAQFENGNLLGPYRKTEGSGFAVSGSNSMLDQMKFNLKNSADTDAAFRLTYSGNWNPGYSGIKPDGITAYADTKLVPNGNLNANSTHITYYSRTLTSTNPGVEIGVWDSGFINGIQFGINRSGVGTYVILNTDVGTQLTITPTQDSTGFFHVSRTANNLIKYFKNNLLIGTDTTTYTTGLSVNSIYIGAGNDFGTTSKFSNKECAFSTIGSNGLTDYEAKALYWIVQKFQTTLGRQVY